MENSPHRILIVDDKESDRKMLCQMSERLGHETETAQDGVEALAKAKLDVDLILLDVNMPGMDGFEVARRIREDPETRDLPIIMVTGLEGKAHRLRAVEVGANDFIAKPVDMIELQVRMTSLLKMKEAQDANKRHSEELEQTVAKRTAALQAEIEERKRTEDQLRQLSCAVQQSPVTIVITDTAGDIQYVNSQFTRTTGYSFDEALGKNPRILKSGYTSPEEYKQLWDTIRAGGEWRGEFHNKKKDGDLYWELAAISPIVNERGEITHFLAVKEDITERKLAEAALRQQLSRISLLNEISHAIAARHDLSSVFHVVLAQLEDHMPVDFGGVLLVNAQEDTLTVAARGPKSQTLAAELGIQEGKIVRVDETDLRNCVQGETIYTRDVSLATAPILLRIAETGRGSVVGVPLRVEEEVSALLVVMRQGVEAFSLEEIEFLKTVGEHVGLAARQAKLYEDLRAAYDELRRTQEQSLQQERLRALGQMASGIAHDFNNALSPVLGFSDLMLAHPAILDDKEAVLRNLSIISTGARDAANVVSRLKEFYRKRKEGEFFLPLDLNAVITQAISLTQPKWKDQALAQGITISIKTDLNKLPIVSGNESELREALTNLIFNAVDAMPEGGKIVLRTYGGVGVWESGSQQELPMHPHTQPPTHVVLEVSDTGLGMDEETRQRCLDPFFTTKGVGGTGMGLSMVFGIVTRHEGIMSVESEPGKGTTFTIQLPVMDMKEPATAPQATTQPIRALRVLLVDDDPRVRAVMTELLKLDGHTLDTATNGREGFEKFQGGTFDLIITDRSMPDMNGDQMALLIKQISPTMPVIMVTGFGDIMDATSDKPAGVDALLGKPVKIMHLREAMERVTA